MPAWYIWLQATQAILWIALTVYTWQSNQRTADRSAVRAIEVANQMLDCRVLRLEEQVKHVPSADTVSALNTSVQVLLERTSNLDGWIEKVENQLQRIDTWLRENK